MCEFYLQTEGNDLCRSKENDARSLETDVCNSELRKEKEKEKFQEVQP